MPISDTIPAPAGRFQTTQWTVVLAAAHSQVKGGRDALGELCEAYWKPLYAFARREGYDEHTAKDLVQGFFLTLIGNRTFTNATPERGRFRSFLIGGLKNFAATEWKRASREKRGGGREIISLDTAMEDVHAQLSTGTLSPEKTYEKQWALTVVDHALAGLRKQFEGRGKRELFEAMAPLLAGEDEAESYAEIGRRFTLSTGALKSLALRLRQAFRTELRREIGRTVSSPLEIDDEFQHLQVALR